MSAPANSETYGELGPAMRALPSEKMKAFVRAYVVHPPGPGALVNSYIAAGYGTPESSRSTLSKNAHELSRDSRIIEAVKEEAQKLLRLGHPEAVNVLFEVMRDGNHKDRVRAAAAILDRADPLQTAHRIDVTHKIEISADEEALQELAALRELNVAREKLIELFGWNGLERLEKMEAKTKMIEGKVIDG